MIDKKVLRHTLSVCPVCRKRIEAQHVERGGAVYMEKICPEHGFFSAVIWRGYRDMDTWRAQTPEITLLQGDECPNACGLCAHHQSGTCCVLLEVTRRCNLRCPFCFANGGDGEDRPFFDILADLQKIAVKGQTLVQLSGGEPTVRDDLPDIVRAAKEAGCRYVQINSNGVRLGEDIAYVKELKEAGLSFVFMQFDGVDDAIYRTLRGQDLMAVKQRAIDNCGVFNIGVTLVPTIVPGVNNHQIGDILRFATAQSPNVRGVHFQPVSYFGRTPKQPEDSTRYTLDELLHDIDEQAADILPKGTLRPSRCDHPLCGFHGDYVVMPEQTLLELNSGVDNAKIATAAQNRAFVARRWDRSRSAPGGRESAAEIAVLRDDWQANSADRVRKAAGNESRSACCCCEIGLNAYVRPEEFIKQAETDLFVQNGNAVCDSDSEPFDMGDMNVFLHRVRTYGFTVTAMAFQDAGNIDLERLKRCSLHVYHQGAFIPFCKFYL